MRRRQNGRSPHGQIQPAAYGGTDRNLHQMRYAYRRKVRKRTRQTARLFFGARQIENEKEIQKLKRNNELKEIEKEDIENSNKVNEYEKEKSETKSKTSERLEQYRDLKKLLLDVKHDEKNINKTYQKRK